MSSSSTARRWRSDAPLMVSCQATGSGPSVAGSCPSTRGRAALSCVHWPPLRPCGLTPLERPDIWIRLTHDVLTVAVGRPRHPRYGWSGELPSETAHEPVPRRRLAGPPSRNRTPSASRLLRIERIQMAGEYRTDQLRRHSVRTHGGMQGKTVEQSVHAFGLELQV